MHDVVESIRDALRPVAERPGARFCVAFSGGLDSSVLLHVVVRLGLGDVRAVYVDHQLQPQSAAWGLHCGEFCRQLGVPFEQRLVTVDHQGGEGPEAAARRARYLALAEILASGETLLTAHHQDDLVETVLLNLLRGSGPAGLAGIPRAAPLGAGWLLRPLLEVPRASLTGYARGAGLTWIEDPSNRDERLDRNFLRHQALPLLGQRWPGVRATVARSARWCAEAGGLLDALGSDDARRVARGGRVLVSRLAALSEARQRNALRSLCRHALGSVPPERRLREGLAQLIHAGPDRQPLLRWGGGEIRRYRGALYLLRPYAPMPGRSAMELPVRGGATLDLGPGLGRLRLVSARGQGLSAARAGASLHVRFRCGGEMLRPVGSAHARELRKLLQERGVVPWMRARMPLLYSGEQLVAVAHLWVAADFVASGAERALRVRWDEHPPLE
ncbi:MAG: tRNA lysidine(34) synthetase TilS [Gammaproteobacteria bacterium]|nr:MAG: tRNA lysidine(34) synthetase TilS [Gammaproteobacteria bacterium]